MTVFIFSGGIRKLSDINTVHKFPHKNLRHTMFLTKVAPDGKDLLY